MTEQELARIEKSYQETTPGDWFYDVNQDNGLFFIVDSNDDLIAECHYPGRPRQNVANAKFIAIAHDIMPKLLAMVKDLQNQVKGYQELERIASEVWLEIYNNRLNTSRDTPEGIEFSSTEKALEHWFVQAKKPD